MHVVLNYLAGGITMAAVFGGFFIAGNLGGGHPPTVRRYFPYAFAGFLIGLDLIARVYGWTKIAARAKERTLLIREGAVAPPRQRSKEVLKALFYNDAGGQFFYVIPVWLIGVVIIALTLAWSVEWLGPTSHE